MGGREGESVYPLVEPLTRREREVLALLGEDLSTQEIAQKLTLALSSTKWYLQQIYGKLGVNNRRQALARARELSLLSAASTEWVFVEKLVQRNNLPVQVSSFIGLETQIQEIFQLVVEHRLVTLTGPGGSGKSRLSLEVGQRALDVFLDGVWFVDLTALTDPALIPGAALAAMQKRLFRGTNDRTRELDRLIQSIQAKSLLLILDNCEHLVEACAGIVDALRHACPNLHLLATSREALNVAGEQAYGVPNLDLPELRPLPPLDRLAQYEAVQLFIERAKSVDHTFALTERNTPAVAHICRRLDGMPLAIELAAVRLKVLAPEQIAARLDDVFSLLTVGNRAVLPRHQTIFATIEWSHNLLDVPEKALFRRLAVFSGGWSLQAAEAICTEPLEDWQVVRDDEENSPPPFQFANLQPGMVLDLLGRLVDKCLVVKEEKDGQARYHMLETIRQFAVRQLHGSEEEASAVSQRHRDWFLELAEPTPEDMGEISYLDKLEAEHDNLRAALAWSIEQRHREKVLRLVNALGGFWNHHNHDEEGYRWVKQVLPLIEEDPALRWSGGWAMLVMTLFTHTLATHRDIAALLPLMEAACEILRKENNGYEVSLALRHLGAAEINLGLWEAAERHFREALELLEGYPPDGNMDFLLLCLGVTVAVRGDYTASREYYRQSLEMFELHSDRIGIVYTLMYYAEDLFLQGQLPAARELSLEAIKNTEAAGMRRDHRRCLLDLGRIYLVEGKFGRARESALKSVQIDAENEVKASLVYLAEIDVYEGRLEEAEAEALEARDWAGNGNTSAPLFNTGFLANLWLGRVSLLRLDFAKARSYLDEAQRLYAEVILYQDDSFYLLTQTQAHAARLEKRFSDARQLYIKNLRKMAAAQHYLYAPESLEGLAMVEIKDGDLELAAGLFGTSHALREQLCTPLPPSLQEEYAACQVRMRQGMLAEELERLWEAGKDLTAEAGIAGAIKNGEEQKHPLHG